MTTDRPDPLTVTIGALSSPEGERAVALALRLLDVTVGGQRMTRGAYRAAPMPTDDQAIVAACRLIDVGVPVDDERDLIRAVAVLKSDLSLDDLRRLAPRDS
jgi:hypothetical protein